MRLVALGLVIALVALALQTAAHLTNAFVLGGRYPALDATRDDNAFTWMSSVATFAAGFAAAVAALAVGRRRLALLASLLVFLSLDDLVQAHERLPLLMDGSAGPLAQAGELVFLAVYLPLLATVVTLLIGAARRGPRRAALAIFGGLAMLTASLAIRVVGAVVTVAGGSGPEWLKILGAAAMQDAELGGWILVAAGLTAIMCHSLVVTATAVTTRG